jgi:dsRNA-specific ribonuclease
MVLAQLGDAALKTCFIKHLYLLQPLLPRGTIQDQIDRMLSGAELCELARSLNISDSLQTSTQRERQSQKSLESLLEAIAGVIFLDGGTDAVQMWMDARDFFWRGDAEMLKNLGLTIAEEKDSTIVGKEK